MAKRLGRIHIGTSGWNYQSWTDVFYKKNINPEEMLPCYAKTFPSVELNNSFYKLPDKGVVKRWVKNTPRDFLFSVKASRYLTHMKKLKDAESGLKRFLSAIKPFGDKLGPIVFQLPGNWRVNSERLEGFLELLPENYRYAFEFRDRSWLCKDIYRLLEDHNTSLCYYHYQGYRSPPITTTGFVYVRLHGPLKKPYEGSYDVRTLRGLSRRFNRWRGEGRDIYCYFDNDQKACAPKDAKRLVNFLVKED